MKEVTTFLHPQGKIAFLEGYWYLKCHYSNNIAVNSESDILIQMSTFLIHKNGSHKILK